MNILFITLGRTVKIHVHGIYSDLMRKFYKEGHDLYIVYPLERKEGNPTTFEEEQGVHYLGVHTLNIQKTNVIEKGIGTILAETQFKNAIKKYFKNVSFDFILYTTLPITFPHLIGNLKKSNPKAISYLMLKDIFPQNAVDVGFMPGSRVQVFKDSSFKIPFLWAKYLLYKYFRKKEKKLYAVSDYIGCMSPANVEFLLKHNPEVSVDRVEVAPNCIELGEDLSPSDERAKRLTERGYIRSKYGLPRNIPIFIYGGNLGKPQGISFLIKCLDANRNRKDCHFFVIGNGTEYGKLKKWYENLNHNDDHNKNVTLIEHLPKEDYNMLMGACDVGMIFLDHRFTIPNYPSYLLSYLESKMPVICAIDPNTDIGRIAEENGYGYWCESLNPEDFTALVDKMLRSDRKEMGERGYEFLKKNYTVQNTYDAIMSHFS